MTRRTGPSVAMMTPLAASVGSWAQQNAPKEQGRSTTEAEASAAVRIPWPKPPNPAPELKIET